jgi:hypothetical protein
MPTKREIVGRPRRAVFGPDIVELFHELEATPLAQRDRLEWKVKSRALARGLGLSAEWWMTVDVHDRSSGPCWPEGYAAHDAWYRVRAVREALLEAAKVRQ